MRKINKKNTIPFSFKVWLHRVWMLFWVLCFICFTVACLWGWYSGYIQRKYDTLKENFHQFLADSGFVLDDILIDGRVRTPKTEIRNALNLPVDNLITTLDISAMQQNLQKLPWIKEASVTRQLPNILYLNLIERKPIALWQNGQKHYPVDEEGNIVDAMCDECVYLPIIVGEDAPNKTPDFIKDIKKFPSIYERLVSAVLINNLRWNLYLDDIEDGIVIMLPDMDLNKSFMRLDKMQKEHNILNKDIKKIDLRQLDRTIIEPRTPESISAPQKGAKKNVQ